MVVWFDIGKTYHSRNSVSGQLDGPACLTFAVTEAHRGRAVLGTSDLKIQLFLQGGGEGTLEGCGCQACIWPCLVFSVYHRGPHEFAVTVHLSATWIPAQLQIKFESLSQRLIRNHPSLNIMPQSPAPYLRDGQCYHQHSTFRCAPRCSVSHLVMFLKWVAVVSKWCNQ